jgi:hypothetical protein
VLKERRSAKDRGRASRVKHSGSEMGEVAIIEIPTNSVKTKTLKTKRKVSFTLNILAISGEKLNLAMTRIGYWRRKLEPKKTTETLRL